MTERMTPEQYRDMAEGKRNKFGARAEFVDGIRFQSKLEARRYCYWRAIWESGGIHWFTRQAPFHLPGGIVYRCDFLIALDAPMKDEPHAMVRIEDCKGVLTRVSANKIKQVEAIYGVKVHLIRKGDF